MGISGYLSYGVFKWLKNVDNFDANTVSENSSTGHNLEVDLKYPYILHELHNYPLLPAIPYDMLPDYCKKIAGGYRIKVGDVKKLVPSLGNKTNYILQYRNLQLYLLLRMKLTKIHKILKFKQSDWMKINFNTKKITNAANSLEEDFFKLIINSVLAKQ